MENFKINDYNIREQDSTPNEFEDFQLLEQLEDNSIENRQEIERRQEELRDETLENLNNIYARNERNIDRDNNSFFTSKDEELNGFTVYSYDGYKGRFDASYSERGSEFIYREDQHKSQDQLSEEIVNIKSYKRNNSLRSTASNVMRAFLGNVA